MPTPSGRVDYLDGIRAVAIAAVLALHWLSWYVPLFHGGSIGVDVFFVLSGFIITTMLWRSQPSGSGSIGAAYGSFLKRRVTRLYPALIGLVVVTVALYAVMPGAALSVAETARRGALALTQASSVWGALQEGTFWLPALQPFAHSWSLAVEWYFYLLWPVPVLAARRGGWSAARLARASLLAAAALYAGSLLLDPHWFYFGPAARSAELLVGAALALHLLSAGSSATGRSRGAVVALGALTAYVLVGPVSSSWGYRLVGIPLAVAATVVLIRANYGAPGAVHRLLSHRWAASVGRHSYSLYLWHIPPFLLLEDAAGPKWALGLGTVALTLTLTALSYRFLERPFLRARSDVLTPRRVALAVESEDASVLERTHEVIGGGAGLVEPDPARDRPALSGT